MSSLLNAHSEHGPEIANFGPLIRYFDEVVIPPRWADRQLQHFDRLSDDLPPELAKEFIKIHDGNAKTIWDTYDGPILDFDTDSYVFADKEKKNVIKVYTRIDSATVKKYYDTVVQFAGTYPSKIQYKTGRSIDVNIHVAHPGDIIMGTHELTYCIQPYTGGVPLDTYVDKHGIMLLDIDSIKKALDPVFKKKNMKPTGSYLGGLNMKGVFEGKTLTDITITDLGANISTFLSSIGPYELATEKIGNRISHKMRSIF